MGVLAQHVPSIEQLKPGLVEIIEDSGSKKFFRTLQSAHRFGRIVVANAVLLQCPEASRLSSPTLS